MRITCGVLRQCDFEATLDSADRDPTVAKRSLPIQGEPALGEESHVTKWPLALVARSLPKALHAPPQGAKMGAVQEETYLRNLHGGCPVLAADGNLRSSMDL